MKNCKETLRIAKHTWPTHAPKQYDRFTFVPIPDSQDKTYCLSILYEAREKRKSVPYVQKMKEAGDSNDYFTNTVSGKVYTEQALIFRPAYKETTAQTTLDELVRRMGAYKASFLKNGWLLFIYGGFLLSTLSSWAWL
jgi:hypothetical protein